LVEFDQRSPKPPAGRTEQTGQGVAPLPPPLNKTHAAAQLAAPVQRQPMFSAPCSFPREGDSARSPWPDFGMDECHTFDLRRIEEVDPQGGFSRQRCLFPASAHSASQRRPGCGVIPRQEGII